MSLGFSAPPLVVGTGPAQERRDLQELLARSSNLTAGGRNLQVFMDGITVVIRGTVTDDHDRRLAEALLRLSPGVREVRNEVVVQTASVPASQSP
jgi:hypothetical protein